MARIHNFSAGPGVLPESVLKQAQTDLWDVAGSGIGVVEHSHRGKVFDAIVLSARDRLRRLLQLDEDQEVLFLHGGARSQFYLWPMNALRGGRAAYMDTGHWAHLALEDAKRYGTVDTVFSSKEQGYDRVPAAGELGELHPDTVYLHYTSNNTIYGTEFHHVPDPGKAWLVCDASSNFLSRPLDGKKFAYLYAGAQKNVGPSGVTIAIVRKWLEEDVGGLVEMERRNVAQADKLYDEIDRTGFWRSHVKRDSRSRMNVIFTTGDAERDAAFLKGAATHQMSGLKGHRELGGLRASVYNAQPDAAVDALIGFMREFERTHG